MNPRVTRLLLAVAVAVPLLAGSPGCESGRTPDAPPDPTTVHSCLPGFGQPALELWNRLDQITLQEGRGWARRVTAPDGTYEALLTLHNELATALGAAPADDRKDTPHLTVSPEILDRSNVLLGILRADQASGAHSRPQDPGWLGRPRDASAWNSASRLQRAAKEALDM